MKNQELKAKIKANSAQGLKKPALFALLHDVLAPEPLERFAGWVRHLENKYATTDLVYRYTGGVGASVRFYVRTNAADAQPAVAISFKVEGDTWVIPDDLPFEDRVGDESSVRQKENVAQLKVLLQRQCGKASTRFVEVERELNRALEQSQGAYDFHVDMLVKPGFMVISFNGGKKPVRMTLKLNRQKAIAADVHQHCVISWAPTSNQVADDTAQVSRDLAKVDFDERQLVWNAEQKEICEASMAAVTEGGFVAPSKEVLTTIQLLIAMTPSEALKTISALANSPEVSAPIATAIGSQLELFQPERNDHIVATFIPMSKKLPWLRLVFADGKETTGVDLFFKDDVLADYRLSIPVRAQRMLDEMFDPTTMRLDTSAQHALGLLAFNCRDEATYKESFEWLVAQTEKGCWAFSWYYASGEEGDVVITLSPDYSQYEGTREVGMAYTYDGMLKIIEDELVEEPEKVAEIEVPEGSKGPFTFAALGSMHRRPSFNAGITGLMLDRPMPLNELLANLPMLSKQGAATDILSALIGRVGYNNGGMGVFLRLTDPQVLEIVAHAGQEVILRVRVDSSDWKLVEAIRPYGLPMFGLDSGTQEQYQFENMSMLVEAGQAASFIVQRAISPESAERINNALARRRMESPNPVSRFRFTMDEQVGRVVVEAITSVNEFRIMTIGLVNGQFADCDRDSAQLDRLLHGRGERTSRYTDRPAQHESTQHMPMPDQQHVREVAEAPTPEPRVFPLGAQASLDKADVDTTLDFLSFVTAGMAQWKVSQALQFVITVAKNVTSELPLAFRVVAGSTIFIQYGELEGDVMKAISSIKIPRN